MNHRRRSRRSPRIRLVLAACLAAAMTFALPSLGLAGNGTPSPWDHVPILRSLFAASDEQTDDATQDKPAATDEPAKKGSSLDALDDELLEGLGDELLEGLEPETDPIGGKGKREDSPEDDAAAEGPQEQAGDEPEPTEPRDELDEELLRGLGSDINLPGDENPLSRIARQMREVEGRIGQKRSDEPTQRMQEQIIDEIDELIAQARRQASQSQGGSGQMGSRRSKPEPGQQAQGGTGGSGEGQSTGPSRDSSERLRDDELRRADMAEMNELLKNLWGHLPDREREQVINSTIERFVPKYELLIEEYFKRLVEEGPDRRDTR